MRPEIINPAALQKARNEKYILPLGNAVNIRSTFITTIRLTQRTNSSGLKGFSNLKGESNAKCIIVDSSGDLTVSSTNE